MLFKYQLPVITWAMVILILTLTPGEHIPSLRIGDIMIDKLLHFGVFLILASLAFAGIKSGTGESTKGKKWRLVLTLCICYGVLVEALQYLVPGRHIDSLDLIANLLGCLAGMLLFNIYQKVASSMAKK